MAHARRRRWWPWILGTLLVLVLAITGVALIYMRRIQPELERSVSDALRMPVRIEGLSISPWRGAVALGPIRIGADADILGAGRITIAPELSTLWTNDIVINRVAIDDVNGVLHLDENYQPVFRTAVTGERAGSPGTYHVTIRELAVAGGSLTVRYPVGKKPRDGKLDVTRFRATNIELGRVAGAALNMSGSFEGAFDEAPIVATTDVRLSEAQPSVSFAFSITGWKVNRDTVTLPPQLDTLTGMLDLKAKLEEGGESQQHALLFDVNVADAGLTGKEGTALSAKKISLPGLRINLAEQSLDLGDVTILGPVLAVRLSDTGVVLPFTPSGQAASPSAWNVTSGDISTRDGTLRVLRRDLATSMTLKSLRWDGLRPKSKGAFELNATIDGGSIGANGTVTMEPQAATVDVQLDKLPLPALTQLADVLPLGLSRGTATGAIKARYGQRLDHVAGHLALNDVHTAPPNPERASEVLAVSAAETDFVLTNEPAPVLSITALKLSYPYIMVQRHADEIFPYSSLLSQPASSSTKASYSAPAIRVDRIAIDSGKVEFLDTTMEPVFWSAFTDMSFDATHVRMPELTVGEFTFKGKHDELSPALISGSLTNEGLQAQAELKDILLETLNGYVAPALGYRFASGRLSTTATTTPAPPLLKSVADVVLRGIDLVQTGRDIVQEQSGVPLPIALRLISNSAGEIRLTLPLAIDTQFQTVSFGSVFWQAVRQAIVGALSTPLRLLGSLFGKKNAPHAFAIDPIPFANGSARPDRAGQARIEEITRILKAHQGLLLVLLPQLTEEEIRAAGAGASALAEARNAAVRDAFLSAADPIPTERILLSGWKPEDAAKATGKPGVYVELQDAS